MVTEIALIAGTTAAGAISAAVIEKLSRSRAAGGNKKIKSQERSSTPTTARAELVSLLFEKTLASEAITRVYEAAQEGRIDRLERDRLLLKYRQQLDEMINMKAGDYSGEDNILYAKAKKVLIRSKERKVTITIDGEPIGILPATFQIFPTQLTVMM